MLGNGTCFSFEVKALGIYAQIETPTPVVAEWWYRWCPDFCRSEEQKSLTMRIVPYSEGGA
jgi:hypothetical protein